MLHTWLQLIEKAIPILILPSYPFITKHIRRLNYSPRMHQKVDPVYRYPFKCLTLSSCLFTQQLFLCALTSSSFETVVIVPPDTIRPYRLQEYQPNRTLGTEQTLARQQGPIYGESFLAIAARFSDRRSNEEIFHSVHRIASEGSSILHKPRGAEWANGKNSKPSPGSCSSLQEITHF